MLGEYDKHGRIRDGGTAEQAEAAASRAWLADTLAGWMARDATGPQPATWEIDGSCGRTTPDRLDGAQVPSRQIPDGRSTARARHQKAHPGRHQSARDGKGRHVD